MQAECIAPWAVAVQLFFPFHHVCLAPVFLDEPADAIAAFAGAFGAFDAEHVELILDVAKDKIGPPRRTRISDAAGLWAGFGRGWTAATTIMALFHCELRRNIYGRDQRMVLRTRQPLNGGARLIDFYDMKIAAGDLSDYLIGFRVLASVRRSRPRSRRRLIVHKQLKGAYQHKGGCHVPFRHSFKRRHYRHGTC